MGREAHIQARRKWVADRKREGVEGIFRAQAVALPLPPSFHDAVRVPRATHAIIVGIKRRALDADAPFDVDVADLVARAEAGGACAIAIWPDEEHDGSYQDILAAAQASSLPVLSRDPVVDPVQIVMARAHGAAAVSVDVATVNDQELRALFRQSVDLGLDMLIEAKTALELERVASLRMGASESSGARVVGVRGHSEDGGFDGNLYDRLAPGVPEFATSIATTAVTEPEQARTLEGFGYDASIVSDPLLVGDFEAAMLRFAGESLA